MGDMGDTVPELIRTPNQVAALLVNGLKFPVTWTTVTNWTLRLPLAAGTNAFSLQGAGPNGVGIPEVMHKQDERGEESLSPQRTFG